jgi:hypothetical protein
MLLVTSVSQGQALSQRGWETLFDQAGNQRPVLCNLPGETATWLDSAVSRRPILSIGVGVFFDYSLDTGTVWRCFEDAGS